MPIWIIVCLTESCCRCRCNISPWGKNTIHPHTSTHRMSWQHGLTVWFWQYPSSQHHNTDVALPAVKIISQLQTGAPCDRLSTAGGRAYSAPQIYPVLNCHFRGGGKVSLPGSVQLLRWGDLKQHAIGKKENSAIRELTKLWGQNSEDLDQLPQRPD